VQWRTKRNVPAVRVEVIVLSLATGHFVEHFDREKAVGNSLPTRDQLMMRIGAAKSEAGRAFAFVQIQLPEARQPVTRESFRFRVDKSKLKEAELRDGHYLLRSNADGEDPAVLWTRYVQLT
jgi:hypothetical protein